MEEKSSLKPLAVVTGASSGIGYELAKQFAQHGYDLIILSENPAIVEAGQTCGALGAEVESYVIDLADYNGVDELKTKIEELGRPVEAIAINMGIGTLSELSSDPSWETELQLINLNVVATLHLEKEFSKEMSKRKSGKILITSSIVDPLPPALQQVYRASLAFIQNFSAAERQQVQGSGVTITELVPAKGELNFSQSAAEVAEHAFKYMIEGEGYIEVDLNKFKSEGEASGTPRPFGEPPKLKH